MPIKDVTYFVFNVRYRDRVYEPAGLPDTALSSAKSWAQLYKTAFVKVEGVQQSGDFEPTVKTIVAVVQDAQQLLGQDADFIQAERIAIHQAVKDKLNAALAAKKAALEANNGIVLTLPASIQ
jgi:hypothetical protein